MRRDFICHRCGTANRPDAGNCAYCGLQIGWHPQTPVTFLFWRWPGPVKWAVGALTAPLAFSIKAIWETASVTTVIAISLLALSLLLLVWTILLEREREAAEDDSRL